ncbi:MAG: PadR family transcriptional regulator [Gemmatimonadota bacterium]|nr:MAG: PadR family transcriptional regulator [Gemmatimonadota bacterium]
MGKATDDSNVHAPLRPVDFHVLLSLLSRDLHGYGVVKEIERRTAGAIKLVPGNLYPVLRRLVEAGWLEETAERQAEDVEHKQRRYYAITALGRRIAAAEAVRLRMLVEENEVQALVEGWSEG